MCDRTSPKHFSKASDMAFTRRNIPGPTQIMSSHTTAGLSSTIYPQTSEKQSMSQCLPVYTLWWICFLILHSIIAVDPYLKFSMPYVLKTFIVGIIPVASEMEGLRDTRERIQSELGATLGSLLKGSLESNLLCLRCHLPLRD